MNTLEFKDKLVEELSKCEKIKGIGQTGDINEKLIPGKSDIDLFVICSSVPTAEERKQMYANILEDSIEEIMNVCDGGIWGHGDIFVVHGIDVMPMYFTIEEMEGYLVDTLNGKHLEKDGRFYPTGRLSSIETINILYEDDNCYTRIVEKVKKHPKKLFEQLFTQNINAVLDEEDLGRVVLRKEVLFYHQVLEEAIDHLLQALFALNNTYFPSRKRTKKYIDDFCYKPKDFYNRLINIINKSISSETIDESVNELRILKKEVVEIKEKL